MLFVSGVLFGKFSRYLSYFGEAVEVVSEINPHGILMIFLPVLIFESGFNADWHIFKKQFGQTFILAFPCVFFGSLFIMLSIKLILQYEDVTICQYLELLHLGRSLYVRQHPLMHRYCSCAGTTEGNRSTKKVQFSHRRRVTAERRLVHGDVPNLQRTVCRLCRSLLRDTQ